MNYLLDKLMEIDKKIQDYEKEVVFLNKTIGKKLHKIGLLKEERLKISNDLETYKQSVNDNG